MLRRVVSAPLASAPAPLSARTSAKRSQIVDTAIRRFAEHGYEDVRVADIASELGIAKGSIFQHFGSKEGLFLEVFKRATSSFPKYLDVPAEVRQKGFFEILRYWLLHTEHLVHEDWIRYRIALLGNYCSNLPLKREINRFVAHEDPYGRMPLIRLGLERGELRQDLDAEMLVSVLDWMMERFQDTLVSAELDPGLFRRSGLPGQNEARIEQLLQLLRRAIGSSS
jgi:TetR/AcrR family transcriptional regulator